MNQRFYTQPRCPSIIKSNRTIETFENSGDLNCGFFSKVSTILSLPSEALWGKTSLPPVSVSGSQPRLLLYVAGGGGGGGILQWQS